MPDTAAVRSALTHKYRCDLETSQGGFQSSLHAIKAIISRKSPPSFQLLLAIRLRKLLFLVFVGHHLTAILHRMLKCAPEAGHENDTLFATYTHALVQHFSLHSPSNSAGVKYPSAEGCDRA